MSPTEPRNCVNVELTVLGSLALIVLVVSVDAKQRVTNVWKISEMRNCVKVEVTVLGSPSLIIRTVSVKLKQH